MREGPMVACACIYKIGTREHSDEIYVNESLANRVHGAIDEVRTENSAAYAHGIGVV